MGYPQLPFFFEEHSVLLTKDTDFILIEDCSSEEDRVKSDLQEDRDTPKI